MNSMPAKKHDFRKGMPIVGRLALAGVLTIGLAGAASAERLCRVQETGYEDGLVKPTECWYEARQPYYPSPRQESGTVHHHYHYNYDAPQPTYRAPSRYPYQAPARYAHPAPVQYSVTTTQTVPARPYRNHGNGGLSNLTLGNAVGAAAGGYVGSLIGKGSGRLAATAAGTLLGYMVGGELGDRRWRRY